MIVEGLTLRGVLEHPAWAVSNAGVLAYGMAHVVIHNCQIIGALHGIWMLGGAQAFVHASQIEGGETGFFLTGRSQAGTERTLIRQVDWGIVVEETAQVAVYRSTIERTSTGVYVKDDGQAIPTHVEIRDSSEDAVVVLGRGQAKVISCRLADNGAGIVLMQHASAVVIDNVITGSRYYGVLLAMYDARLWFEGCLVGGRNVIPRPGEPGENHYGAVYPNELAFLLTEKGGVYPGR